MFQLLLGDGSWCGRCGEPCSVGEDAIRVVLPKARDGARTYWWHRDCHAKEVALLTDEMERRADCLGIEPWSPAPAPRLTDRDLCDMAGRMHA